MLKITYLQTHDNVYYKHLVPHVGIDFNMYRIIQNAGPTFIDETILCQKQKKT